MAIKCDGLGADVSEGKTFLSIPAGFIWPRSYAARAKSACKPSGVNGFSMRGMSCNPGG